MLSLWAIHAYWPLFSYVLVHGTLLTSKNMATLLGSLVVNMDTYCFLNPTYRTFQEFIRAKFVVNVGLVLGSSQILLQPQLP